MEDRLESIEKQLIKLHKTNIRNSIAIIVLSVGLVLNSMLTFYVNSNSTTKDKEVNMTALEYTSLEEFKEYAVSYIVRYGKTISLDPEQYLTIWNTNIIDDIKISTNIVNEVGKDYPPCGKYEIVFTYKLEKTTVKIEVLHSDEFTRQKILCQESGKYE